MTREEYLKLLGPPEPPVVVERKYASSVTWWHVQCGCGWSGVRSDMDQANRAVRMHAKHCHRRQKVFPAYERGLR